METITARKDLNGMTKVDMEEYFDDVEVESLYSWIDRIPLSRPKKNISKDFSDAGKDLNHSLEFKCVLHSKTVSIFQLN